MVDFSDIADSATAHWFSADLADSVTYNGSSIPAHVEYGEDLEQGGGAVMAVALLEVRKSDVADPQYRDKVIIAGETWLVRNAIAGDAWAWRLRIVRDERPMPFGR